jgi:hypothetical protein
MGMKPKSWDKDKFRNYWALAFHTGCWVWLGRKYPNTYGRIGYMGSEICAHRLSWILHKGPIPYGLWVLHKCDNPQCVNPDHLFLGTHRDNEDDKVRKGRQMHAEGHYAAKLSLEQVDYIRCSLKSGVEMARKFGVSTSLVSMIRSNRIWRQQ